MAGSRSSTIQSSSDLQGARGLYGTCRKLPLLAAKLENSRRTVYDEIDAQVDRSSGLSYFTSAPQVLERTSQQLFDSEM
jgi:hypothetical protein